MSVLPRIYADFNNADEDGRLRLNVRGALDDIARLENPLNAGDQVTFYDAELEVEGSIEPSETAPKFWVGRIDWTSIRDRPVD